MESIMKISETTSGDVRIISIAGRLDANSYLALESHLNQLIQSGEKKLLIDFKQMAYLSSTGLSTLIQGAQKMNAARGKMVFCCVDEKFIDVFEVSGLKQYFVLFPTQEAGLKAFS